MLPERLVATMSIGLINVPRVPIRVGTAAEVDSAGAVVTVGAPADATLIVKTRVKAPKLLLAVTVGV